jgi:CPA2 family monovalent cation:H+ antiporter-2
VGTALMVSASLAQIGEFSFILAGLGIALGLMPAEGRDLILAGALLSVTLNPLVFAAIEPVQRWIRRQRRVMVRFEGAQDLRLARLQATLDAQKRDRAALQPDELISKWAVFADLDFEQRTELLALFKPRPAVPGDRLIHAGDVADEVFFISSGSVEVSVNRRKITLGPGDFFGEMALLTGGRRSADVTALDYCQLLTLSSSDFERFLERHPELRARMGRVATEREHMNRLEPAPEPVTQG